MVGLCDIISLVGVQRCLSNKHHRCAKRHSLNARISLKVAELVNLCCQRAQGVRVSGQVELVILTEQDQTNGSRLHVVQEHRSCADAEMSIGSSSVAVLAEVTKKLKKSPALLKITASLANTPNLLRKKNIDLPFSPMKLGSGYVVISFPVSPVDWFVFERTIACRQVGAAVSAHLIQTGYQVRWFLPRTCAVGLSVGCLKLYPHVINVDVSGVDDLKFVAVLSLNRQA